MATRRQRDVRTLAAGLAVLAAALAGPIVAVACRPAPMDAVGFSSPRATGASPVEDAGPSAWSSFESKLAKGMNNVVPRQRSRGHGERFDAIVWVNDEGLAAWDSGGVMPDGAVLIEEAVELAATGDRPQGLLVMEKKDGAWAFRAVGTDGGAVTDARCEKCHAEAPRDDVFRVDQSRQAAITDAMTPTVPTAVATTAATYDARSAGRADASLSP
jgi:hypothetical protein